MGDVKDLLDKVDKEDITFVLSLGTDLIKAGMEILQTMQEARSFDLEELIELANTSAQKRDAAQQAAHEYIISKLQN